MTAWQLGDIEVILVPELLRPIATPANWFLDYDADELAPELGWLVPGFLDGQTGRKISSVHTYVLRAGSRTILVDTGVGNGKPRPGWDAFDNLNTNYLEDLRAAGIRPEQVDLVVCTHLHIDHVGWNTSWDGSTWVPTFPNARYLFAQADYDHFAHGTEAGTLTPASANTFRDSVEPVLRAGLVDFLKGDEDIGDGLALRPTPGHTPGHLALDLVSRGQRAVFSGDVLHHPLQIPLWQWRTRVCWDPELATRTRHELLGLCADTGALLLPAHFPPPTAVRITRSGNTFTADFDG